MAQKLFLGLDIGTSSAKGTLVAETGAIVAQARVEYTFESLAPGHAEIDPDVWVSASQKLARTLAEKADPKAIAAIGVAGQMRGVTLIGADNRPVRKSLLWNDTRCTAEVAEAMDRAGLLLRAQTINPLNTMASLPKFLWLMRHEPEIWRATKVILLPKDYVTLALTGSVQTDYSDASGTSIFDLGKAGWSAELLDLFAIDPDKLPEVRRSSDVVGTLTAEAAAAFGLPAGIPVVAGGSDSTVDSYACGLAPGEVKIRLGSSGAISWLIDTPDAIGNDNVYCWSFLGPDRFLADINTRSCAQSVDWFCRLAYREHQALEAAYGTLQDEAGSIAPGAGGLVFRPHLQGEDAPFWDPGMTGSFTGLTTTHTRAHMARAVLEGTAFALADALSVTGLGTPAHARLVGGGTHNRVWTGILRDLIGCETSSHPDTDTAYGAALLAAAGIGAPVAQAQHATTIEQPDPGLHRRYAELLAVYRDRKMSGTSRETDT